MSGSTWKPQNNKSTFLFEIRLPVLLKVPVFLSAAAYSSYTVQYIIIKLVQRRSEMEKCLLY